MKKAILSLVFCFLSVHIAQAYQTIHHTTAFLGPFNASNASFQYIITPKSYLVQTNIQTNGFFGSVYPFTAEYKTTGIRKNNLFK